MTKQDLITELEGILEVDELKPEQGLSEMDEFDSLAVMSIVALVFSRFKKKISGAEIKNIKTANDLIALIGEENFSA